MCDVVASLTAGETMPRSLEVGFKRIPLSSAVTSMGLPSEWREKLQASHAGRSQALVVNQLVRGMARSASLIVEGDLLLAVDEQPVCTFREVETFVGSKAAVALTVLRDEEVVALPAVQTEAIDAVGTDRILIW